MANTFELIASSTAGSGGAASFTFTAIPATYTDLTLQLSVRAANSGGPGGFVLVPTINGSTSNFSWRRVGSDGTTAFSDSGATNYWSNLPGSTVTANTFASFSIYIPSYTSSNNKSISLDSSVEINSTLGRETLMASLWSNSAAITSIGLAVDTGNFEQYSSAYLYGVKNA
jgi:hypothetical protein